MMLYTIHCVELPTRPGVQVTCRCHDGWPVPNLTIPQRIASDSPPPHLLAAGGHCLLVWHKGPTASPSISGASLHTSHPQWCPMIVQATPQAIDTPVDAQIPM